MLGRYSSIESSCQNLNDLDIEKLFQQLLEPVDLYIENKKAKKLSLLLTCERKVVKKVNLPNTEKKTAPTKPINGSSLGTAAATPPIIKMIPARKRICEILCLSFGILGSNFFHKISIGT